MDPAQAAPSQFELPPLQPDPNKGKAGQPEAVPNAEALPPQPAAAPSTPLPPMQQMQTATQAAAVPVPTATGQAQTSGAPAAADDLDLIEKEWVDKAKEIVARTHSDPHTQNNEMTRFKADYMKKRYGKDIKVGDA